MTEHYRELFVAARKMRQGLSDREQENMVRQMYYDTHTVYEGQKIDFNSWLAGFLLVANLVDTGKELAE